jgi:LysR family transcriptional regulator, transcription activator of glutamate synthase operon
MSTPAFCLGGGYASHQLDEICQAAGFSPNIVFEVDDSLMDDMLELERGIALLPKYLIERPHSGQRHLKMLRIDQPDTRIQIGLSWRKHKYFSNTAQHFRNFIIENYK